LLQTADPVATVERLVIEREPFYQAADLTIWSREVPHEKIVDECVDALHVLLCREAASATAPDTAASDPLDTTR
jgi:shikimate kinase